MVIATFTWFQFWLILHILAVVAAFGPTFAFGLIFAVAQREPMHMGFAAEITEVIQRRMTIPLAVIVPFLGLALIITGRFDLWKSEWLVVAIILYTILFFFALLVQNRNGAKLVRLLKDLPPGTQPPADVPALGRKLQMGGAFMGLMFVAILVLMVWRPGSCQGAC
jgi:Predicted integral membrane protein (DUF2269)